MSQEEINIEPLGAQNEKDWDALVRIAHNGHLMARPGFFRYHADRFEDASVFILRDRKPLAVLPANRVGDTVWSHQGVSFGGLILHPRARFDHIGAAVEALVEYLRKDGIRRLIYRPAPHPYSIQPREEDIHFLELAGARRVDTKLHSMVPCDSGITLAKKWNRINRRAHEAGVRTREGTDKDLPQFWDEVLRILASFGQKPVHSLDDVRLLRSRFPNNIPLRVAVDRDGNFLAGHLTLVSGKVMTAMYLGETEHGRALNAGTVINDHHLRAPENVGNWFDLGQWCDTSTRETSDTLLQYKESMGGRLIQRHTWQLEF